MKVDGACFCGQITYEAEIDTNRVLICNCTDCQTLSGSAFRTVAFTTENGFTLLSGAPRIYVKIADSGNPRQQAFCQNCGSPLYATSDPAGPFYGVRVGTIKQRDQLVPKVHIFNRSKQHWLDAIPSLPPSRACLSPFSLTAAGLRPAPPRGRRRSGGPRSRPVASPSKTDSL